MKNKIEKPLAPLAQFAFITGALLFQIFQTAFAAFSPIDSAANALNNSATAIFGNLQSTAISLFSGLLLIQFIITQFNQLFSELSLAKTFKLLVWGVFCMFLIKTGPDFLKFVVNAFLTNVASWSGATSFDTESIFQIGLDSYATILNGVAKATSKVSTADAIMAFFSPGNSLFLAILVGITTLVMLAACSLIAVEIFLVKIEATLNWVIAPLSFALLGLTMLKDQGIAPFKVMLALVYRIVILGAVVAAMPQLGSSLAASIAQPNGNASDAITPVWAACFGYVLLAFLAFRAKSLATSLANGSANLGSGDVAAAAVTGAAVAAGMGALYDAAKGGASALVGASNGASNSISGASGGGQNFISAADSGGSISPAGGGSSGASGGSISPAAAAAKVQSVHEAGALSGAPSSAIQAASDAAAADKGFAAISEAVQSNGGTAAQADAIATAASQGGDMTPAQRSKAIAASYPTPSSSPSSSGSASAGNASSAGIASPHGTPSSPTTSSGKKSAMDYLSDAGRHGSKVADQAQRDGSATTVSISAHHTD